MSKLVITNIFIIILNFSLSAQEVIRYSSVIFPFSEKQYEWKEGMFKVDSNGSYHYIFMESKIINSVLTDSNVRFTAFRNYEMMPIDTAYLYSTQVVTSKVDTVELITYRAIIRKEWIENLTPSGARLQRLPPALR